MPQEYVQKLDGTYHWVQVCRCDYPGAHIPGCPHFLGRLNVRHWASRAEAEAFREARVWKLAVEGVCDAPKLHDIAWQRFEYLMNLECASEAEGLRRQKVIELLLEPFK